MEFPLEFPPDAPAVDGLLTAPPAPTNTPYNVILVQAPYKTKRPQGFACGRFVSLTDPHNTGLEGATHFYTHYDHKLIFDIGVQVYWCTRVSKYTNTPLHQ